MQESDVASIGKPATSFRIETRRVYAIKDVLDIIMEMLPHWINRWERGGFSTIREEWSARCCYMGDHITVGE